MSNQDILRITLAERSSEQSFTSRSTRFQSDIAKGRCSQGPL